MHDIVIIGAGIVGAMCAFELGQQSNCKIAIVEQGKIASGATQFSIGLRNTKVFHPDLKPLCTSSFHYYEKLKREIEDLPDELIPIDFLLNKDQHMEALFIEQPMRLTDTDAALSKYGVSPQPELKHNKAIYTSNAFIGDAKGVAEKLINKFLEVENHNLYEDSKITKLTRKPDYYELTIADKALVLARKVVLCAGPYAKFLPFRTPVNPAIRTKKVMYHEVVLQTAANRGVLYLQDDKAFIVFKERTNRCLLSFTSQDWDVAPPFKSLVSNTEDLANSKRILEKYFGKNKYEIADTKIHSGIYSPNWKPEIKHHDNSFFFVTGTSGSGYKYAPVLAQQLRHLINTSKN